MINAKLYRGAAAGLLLLFLASCGPGLRSLRPDVPKALEFTLIAVGDIMPAHRAVPFLSRFGVDYPFLPAKPILSAADIAVGNLESPLTLRGTPVPDKPFTFRADPACAEGIRSAGFDFLSLANNHILDYGLDGWRDTTAALRRVGIAYAGAGADLSAARLPAILSVQGWRVAFLAYCTFPPEDFFAAADRPGSAPGNPKTLSADIRRAAALADIVIACFHWGREGHAIPEGQQTQLAQNAIDAGAHLVLGTHPHVLQGFQWSNGGLVAYSLGNFAFGTWGRAAKTGAILRVTFRKGRPAAAEVIPIIVDNRRVLFQPKKARGAEKEAILSFLDDLSRPFQTRVRENGRVVELPAP